MKNEKWTYQGVEYRLMNKKEYQRALEAVADAICAYGYEVSGISADWDCMDVWGYESTPGKRRRKCFLEIYTQPGPIGRGIPSLIFSHPNYDREESIEVLFNDEWVPNVSDLVTGIIEVIEPLKKRKNSR